MKANLLVSTANMGYEDWLTLRKCGIGGSDAAAVCGLSRWKSPVEVWLEKTEQAESKPAGESAYWGSVLEPIVRAEFIKRTDLPVKELKAILQHPDHSFMLANVDGLVDDPEHGTGIFEAKTANEYAAKDWEDGLPDEYVLQIQHYLAVTGLSFAYVAVLIGGDKFKWQFVPRNESVISMLIELEGHFWSSVVNMTPPPFDGSKASSDLLARLYPEGKPKSQITLPDEAEALINEFESYQQQEKLIIEKKDKAANMLKAMLGESETGVVSCRSVCWKTISSERLDSKKLKLELPDVYAQYVSQSTYRRFAVK